MQPLWTKETNSCFLRIGSKAVRIQQNLYTAFEWMTKQPTKFHFLRQCICDVPRENVDTNDER